jgi:biotin carboxylase
MTDSKAPTIICVASFFKGNDFIRECKRLGAAVVLLTREKLLDADWARESLDDLIAIPGKTSVQSYLAPRHTSRGNGECFASSRSKSMTLSQRLTSANTVCFGHGHDHRALLSRQAGNALQSQRSCDSPTEVCLFVQHEVLDEFMKRTSSPWMLKPRTGASSMGIKKLHDPETVWRAIADLDAREQFHERSAFHLLEQFLPGDVYHVDSLVAGSRVLFASVERYGAPPFEVSHSGGVPISYFVKHGSQEQRALLKLNKKLLNGFGFEQGVTHAEFIRRADSEHESDRYVFLEVAARVGGAYTADTIAAATGINLWCEWAKIELATPERPYILPPICKEYGGIAYHWHVRKTPVLPTMTIPRSCIGCASRGMSA